MAAEHTVYDYLQRSVRGPLLTCAIMVQSLEHQVLRQYVLNGKPRCRHEGLGCIRNGTGDWLDWTDDSVNKRQLFRLTKDDADETFPDSAC